MTILDEIAEYAKKRVKEEKEIISPEKMKKSALSLPKGDFSFEKALKKDDIAFICECKKASPSKGIIAENFPYLDIAKEYEQAGADCISVLTEPKWFLGKDEYLKKISENVGIPVIASGGAGALEHFSDAFTKGKADAVLAASLFHFGEISIGELKDYLSKNNISVRR